MYLDAYNWDMRWRLSPRRNMCDRIQTGPKKNIYIVFDNTITAVDQPSPLIRYNLKFNKTWNHFLNKTVDVILQTVLYYPSSICNYRYHVPLKLNTIFSC